MGFSRGGERGRDPDHQDAFGSAASATLMATQGCADLTLVQHALAHVDDLEGLAAGLAQCLAPEGAIAIEFHDLASLIAGCQFDILGHGHRSYLSLTALERLLARHGLSVVAARRTPIHGGTIQALATRAAPGVTRRASVHRLLARDAAGDLTAPETYVRFGQRAMVAAARVRRHLETASAAATLVVGYGAPARAVGLLSIADVGPALLPFTADRDPEKRGLCLPGSAIPIRDVDSIDVERPGEVLILAWTWAGEIGGQLARVGTWGGRLVVPMPRLRTIVGKDPEAA